MGDLFKAKDVEMAGMLSWEAIRDVLHQAMLGLSMMQIYTVISEAENQAGSDGMIKSMLSFEKSINSKHSQPQSISDDSAKKLFAAMDEAFPGGTASSADIVAFLEQSGHLQSSQELQMIRQYLSQIDTLPIAKAKTDVWQLLKQIR